MRHQNRRQSVVVTGSSTGIGKAIALELDARGFQVFAVQAITDSLRLELAPFGIDVTIVDPGAIESALWEKGRAQKKAILDAAPQELMDLYAPLIEIGRQLGENPRDILPASRVAKEVVHALSSSNPKTRYLVGPGAKKAAKLARMPVWLRDWLISRFMSSGIQDSGRAASPRFGVKNEATNA